MYASEKMSTPKELLELEREESEEELCDKIYSYPMCVNHSLLLCLTLPKTSLMRRKLEPGFGKPVAQHD